METIHADGIRVNKSIGSFKNSKMNLCDINFIAEGGFLLLLDGCNIFVLSAYLFACFLFIFLS